jgi:hypothetical protein
MTLHENGGTENVKLTNKKASEKPEESKTQQLIGGSVKPEATARTASTQRCCGDGGCVSTTHMKWKPSGVGANGSVRTQMKCLRPLQTLMRHTRPRVHPSRSPTLAFTNIHHRHTRATAAALLLRWRRRVLAHTSSDWHNGRVRGADKPRPTTGNPKLVHHTGKHNNSECTSPQPHLHPVLASVLGLTTGWRGFKPAIAVE